MNLKQGIEYGLEIKKSLVIGKEITVDDTEALILGLQTAGNLDALLDEELEAEEPEYITVLYLLYEDRIEDDDDDDEDEDDWDDDTCQEETNRQMLLEEMEDADEEPISNIGAFRIGGRRFATDGMDNDTANSPFWKSGEMLRQAAAAGRIPAKWLAADFEDLWICGYQVDPSIYEVNWDDAELEITTEQEYMPVSVLVGERFLCECKELETPRVFLIQGPDGEDVLVKIHGITSVDFGTLDEDMQVLIPERGSRMLVLKYQAPEGLRMNFYSTEYLEREASEGAAAWGLWGMDNEEPDMKYCMIDFVPQDFEGPLELELFSYTIEEE